MDKCIFCGGNMKTVDDSNTGTYLHNWHKCESCESKCYSGYKVVSEDNKLKTQLDKVKWKRK